MGDEEVQQVTEALDVVERIEDLEQRVRVKSRIMADQVRRNRVWAEERKQLIQQLHEGGLSYREIAARLEIKLSTVQDVFRGYTGSGTARPKKSTAEPPA
ncbi:helix-turn-helix domain-containing protein [Kitasatospora fiedleri]|uniref:helix-turn-helix domain-containing protein n=1 Tax=Kitasatospora fiedleri TaxID=2991545 RepID=UPI00249A03B5|nr:helix-turn-helix domain-containing protein [Kitasatospora fiedleri]